MTKAMPPGARDTGASVPCRGHRLPEPSPPDWCRRIVVAALLLLPLSASLGGCAATRPSDSRAALLGARDDLRVFLRKRSADPAEADRFLTLADAIEDRALALPE